ncbi:MAG: TIGR04283 family arsenosugar biosynthesis glycosyltransferase [Thermodesulfovibrionales bacterium]|nr:TIGR04283 family arsenosugar biosynthesis glycosyltransferase [Thermodesulfovibrionales bacterium]
MKLSVIIPALNEENFIIRCIESAKTLNPSEIIVVDAGSSDKTAELAEREGALVIKSSPGRGIQLMKGALASEGEILMFLHADSIISEPLDIKSYINNGFSGGFLRLKFDYHTLSLRLVEFFANLRAKLLNLPYGDQAIFVRRDIFYEIGGFRDYPFLEDIDFVMRLRKRGRLASIPVPVIVSSRRLLKGYPLSPIFVSLRNVMIVMLFLMGFSPFKLKRLYK